MFGSFKNESERTMSGWINNRYDDGIWYGDEFDSREDAIADGVEQYKDALNDIGTELFDDDYPNPPSGIFYIGRVFDFHPTIDAERIIEYAQEEAYDICGEAAEDYLDWHYLKKEDIAQLQNGLQQVFDIWLSDHQSSISYINNIEEINAADYL